jgi:thioesterase-3
LKSHQYFTKIGRQHLDQFQHVNNAQYLNLYEDARWDLITQNGFGLEKIKAAGLGPVILEAKITFEKELILDDEIIIETKLVSYEKKIGKLEQIIKKKDIICSRAEFLFGLFDLVKRELVLPTPEWLGAVGLHHR